MSRFWPATLVLLQFRITYQPEQFNQILATADLGHRTLRHHVDRMNTKTRLRARATCSICSGASSITEISLFLTFPLKSQEEHRAAVETLPRRPSISQIKRTHQQYWGASPNTFSHICQRFQVLRRRRLSVPQQKQVWALKVPQREVKGEKRERGHWSGCVTLCSLP